MKMLKRLKEGLIKVRKQLKNQRKDIEKNREPSYENAPNKPMRFKKISDASSAPKEEPKPARKKPLRTKTDARTVRRSVVAERTISETDRAEKF